jgi:prophage regulatory protein
MTSRLLKINQVVDETSLSRATIYRAIGRGEFPDRIKLSPRRVGWAEAEVTAWIEAQRRCPGGTAGGIPENQN